MKYTWNTGVENSYFTSLFFMSTRSAIYRVSMVNIDSLIGQNITIVFDDLDLAVVDTIKLRSLAGDASRPTIMETPDMIVAVFPPNPIILQIGDKRFRYTIPRNAETASLSVLPDMVGKSIGLLTKKQFKPVAYGFNYDISLEVIEQTVSQLLNQRFAVDVETINNKVGGELSYFAPRLVFRRKSALYDLFFEVSDQSLFLAHLNVHFQLPNNSLPQLKVLRKQFEQEFHIAHEVLLNLLGESES